MTSDDQALENLNAARYRTASVSYGECGTSRLEIGMTHGGWETMSFTYWSVHSEDIEAQSGFTFV